MKFESLEKGKASVVEAKILEKWKKDNILKLTIDNREKSDNYVFYDGPIYANAKPGIHHVFAKTIKDSFCKYKTMKGYKVLRKIGLDTHGLPIEVNVEKKLGFKTKADIENFGVENFCKQCNIETDSNIDEVKKVTDMMGQFIDCEHPYVTCDNEYIESEWWIVKEFDKKGLIYHGSKVLPYCPRCGTELASHEVSQGYKEVSVNTVIVPFKKKDSDEYFLVWTTTPWTLIANLALCVNPDLTYIKAESMGYKFIVAQSLADKVLGEEYKVLETYKGSDLVGIEYEQLIPEVKVEGNAFKVLADNYVTAEDGTGIVHIAPAYGEDDNRVCRLNDITFINPVGKDGCYLEGPWKGRLVTDPELEIDIIKYLKANDKLFKKIKMTHDYPHCWRCKQPLIYYAKPAWYVKNTAYKDKIIEANKEINWYPDYVGTKRFNNWLENMIDWGISRNRYWGCPLPIWTCDKCDKFHVIGSLDELQEMLIEDVDVRKIELHRPYVDDLHIKCPHCGGTMERVKDVMDVWFDSGSMPYAQYHYPFENKELFESQFPADFIAEGVDQTRGWFYVLLVISTIISGKSSFKNVVVNDMMLDSQGKKMSKSVGNIINPIEIMEQYGADTIRWYMLSVSPVWTPLKFDENGVKEISSRVISTLKNTYNFFAIYANADKLDPKEFKLEYNDLTEIDKWLFSKYNKLVMNVTKCMDEYDLTTTVRSIGDFISEDLSNWYIRRNRRRFWKSELDMDKKAVYYTTYTVLEGLCRLIAPIAPYISEEIYTKLTGKKSVHLEDYPVYNEKYISEHIESRMDLVRNLISLGRNLREEVRIKVRQPISECLIDGKNEELISDLVPLIKEELNVKEVIFINEIDKYMNFLVKPNFKEVGKIFGPKIKLFSEELLNLSTKDVIKLQNGEIIKIDVDGTQYDVDINYVDIRTSSKEGFDVATDSNNFVILNTTLSKDLIDEGIAREIVSKVQNLRKEKNFEITDRITLYYNGDSDVEEAISKFDEFIKEETLSTDIIKKDDLDLEFDINGHTTYLDVIKNN
ncbi:MAG: isoleucine--tRNA ligase [Bacilli bacterium]|nr:isoleucine--tRNA ligase [Bacilli bacterium]